MVELLSGETRKFTCVPVSPTRWPMVKEVPSEEVTRWPSGA
jgi:hypothetical protein